MMCCAAGTRTMTNNRQREIVSVRALRRIDDKADGPEC